MSWLSQRFTPPKSTNNIIRAAAAPFTLGASLINPRGLHGVLPKPLSKGLRYYGAGIQSTFFPILPASVTRKTFGLNGTESKFFETDAKVSRGVIAAVAAVAGGHALITGNMALDSATAGNPALGAVPSHLALGPASLPGGGAGPLSLNGGAGALSLTSAPTAAGSLPAASFGGVPIATAAQLGTPASAAASPAADAGFLAGTVAKAKSFGEIAAAALGIKTLLGSGAQPGDGKPGFQGSTPSGGVGLGSLPSATGGADAAGGGAQLAGFSWPMALLALGLGLGIMWLFRKKRAA